MSNLARAVELVERAAEADAAARRPPAFREAINEALGKAYPPIDKAYAEEHPGLAARDRPSHDDREMMACRYGLFVPGRGPGRGGAAVAGYGVAR